MGFFLICIIVCFIIEFMEAMDRIEIEQRKRRSYVRDPDDDFDKSGPINPLLDKLGYYD